ncbi:PREDICTED: uncharacterized protein LOC104280011, partial [Apaloderma vittatum]|uniref:uncharacterized protein LOC104280011 n=1 Tax=Apaloderma vittatum TaxID=57397 RepID=UPI0005211EF5
EANEHIWMDLESKAAPNPTFPEHTAGTGEERSSTPTLDTAEKHKILPKPKLRLPVILFASHKRSSICDVSYSEDDTGTSSFMAATNSLHLSRKGHEVPPLPTRLSEDAVPQSSSAGRGEAVDGATGTTAWPEYPPKETYSPSKIPVRGKPSKTFSRSEQFLNHMEPTENSDTSRKLLESPKLLTTEGESSQAVKQGRNYTISSMSNREEDIGLDREHFKNLKNFWEKGADSVAMGSMPVDPSCVEADGRRFKLCHSLSVQPGQGQNSKEKSGIFTKTRIPYKRTITLSSSEEEPSYLASARKGLVSIVARSTNTKSKGCLAARNSSLSESNGKSLVPEEEKVAQHCSKKSKWPVQVPSVKIESPTKDASGSMFEPETLTNELTVAEERKHASNSLASRVQILIEPVLTDGENDDEKEKRSDLGTFDKMEINGELPEEKVCESSDKPTPGEAARERETIQGTASAVSSEQRGDHYPATQALAQANSINLVKSMVKIYTTTE